MSERARNVSATSPGTSGVAEHAAGQVENAQHLNSAELFREMHTQITDSVTTTDVPVLRRAAMDSLARREHSFYELSQKLLVKFPNATPETVDAVVSRLRAQNLQSDERFTEAYIRYRKTKGFAYLHIKSDLVQRKVPLPIINAYLFEDDAEWQHIATQLVERKIGAHDKLVFGSKLHRRISRFLESRGFSQLEARRVLASKLG